MDLDVKCGRVHKLASTYLTLMFCSLTFNYEIQIFKYFLLPIQYRIFSNMVPGAY